VNTVGVAGAVAIGLVVAQLYVGYQRDTGGITNERMTPTRGEPKNLAYLKKNNPAIRTGDVPERRFKIIDVHEHVVDEKHALMLEKSMDEYGIQRTCLVASSWYTFTLDNQFGFERYKENNEELIRVRKKYPDRFCAFVTINPPEEGNLELLKDYVARGADGLKLYLGHGASTGKGPFHMMRLDDPRMLPIYEYAQEVQLPIVFHVNLIKYFDEFVAVMEQFPYLRVNVPHFGLHKNTGDRLRRFEWLMDRYPNIYTDVSFGWWEFHIEGFEALSKWPSRSNQYFTKHRERIMYAGDMVIEPTKNQAYIDDTIRSYRQLLEMKQFRFFLEPDFLMHGLALDDETLGWIYEKAPAEFLFLDKDGMLPDRSQGWPPPGWVGPKPGIPPAVPEVVPLAPGDKPWLNLGELQYTEPTKQ
jgi:predicted TIM-barrel fold metal-dependent hydrolase